MKIRKLDLNTSIILISLIYGLIVKFGFVGFGTDYVHAYHKTNVIASSPFNSIGWYLSTLTIYDIKLGTFLVPFFIALSSGYLLKYFFYIQNLNSNLFLVIFFIISLFSWPLLISSNNAMRQGLMMSFIFFSLIFFADKKFALGVFFIFIATFTHRSGLAFLLVMLTTHFYFIIIKKKIINRNINYFIYGFLLFLTFFYLNFFNDVYYGRYGSNKTIGLDFRYLNLLFNLFFIFYFTLNYKLLDKFIFFYLYLFSFSALSILIAGLNWEYERYNMIMMPVYIYALTACFKSYSKYLYLLISLTVLFILTILTGMYDYGVGVYSWEQININ